MKLVVLTLLLSFNLAFAATLLPPVAKQQEHLLEKFGDIRSDEYYWLKERTNPEVIKYLMAENKYLSASLKGTEKLQKKLFSEMKSRIKEDDSTYPLQDGPYLYYTRFEKKQQYPIFCRKKTIPDKEEVLFNINQLAKKHSYYSAHYKVSPDHKIAALSFDTVGRRFYTIKFKDLTTGKFLKNEITSITDNFVWAQDNKTLFYTKQDPETLRWFQVYRYNLDQKKSELVYEEKQDTFEVSVETSLAEKHIFINSSSTLSTEVRVINADKPATDPELLLPREKDHEFNVTEDEDSYYVLSNKDAKDFKIIKLPFNSAKDSKPEIFLPQRLGTHIDNIIVFKDFVAVNSRSNGLTQIEIIDKKSKALDKLDFKDTAYTVELGANAEYAQKNLRYTYTSLRSPVSVYDYNFITQKSELRKTKEVPHFNSDNYVSERIFVTSRDGRQIPVSLLMKKDLKRDASAPLLIYGYGSYGLPTDPWFDSAVFSLVDRGYIYAIAHVRGGGEMGRFWTDEGRTFNKKNTFYDFIDATEFLIQQKYANPKKVFAMGGSAGGLLMGAIANLRPDLYHGIIAQVPFVDVLTTMLDDSIPLTTAEYDEWGNPNEKKDYDYIKSYSPYDNVTAQAYPHLLIETGLHDSQVQYWEPAKWTARLRRLNTSKNFIFLKTDMDAGHGGKSGRFDQLKEEALEYAFILEMENK
jgi:oligopeptidase B